jgi:hypothetical protein
MAITPIASAHEHRATANTTVNLTVPAGVTTAHLGVLVCHTNQSGTVDFSVSGWTQRTENPTGEGASETAVFTRLGGVTAGNVVTVTLSAARIVGVHIMWYNTGGNDIALAGTAGTRSGVSGTTLTIPGITTTVASQDVIVIAKQHTPGGGATITGWTPSAPVMDYDDECGTSGYNFIRFSHFTQATAGATGNYVATFNLASPDAVGVMFGIAVPGVVTNPKIATFTEAFSSGTINTSTWEVSGTPAPTIDSNSRLAVPLTPDYGGVQTWQAYDLTSSSVYAQMFVPPQGTDNGGSGTNESQITLCSTLSRYNADNEIMIQYTAGGLWIAYRNGGTEVGTWVDAYNPAVHGTWFRVRHTTGTTVIVDSSVDATTWVQRATGAISWDLTAVTLGFWAGRWGTETASTAYFDNVNTAPVAATVTTVWSSEPSQTALSLGWTTSGVTSARAVLSTNSSLTSPTYSPTLTPSASGNVAYRFTGLLPSTTYYVGIETNGTLNANGRGNYKTLAATIGNSVVVAGSCNVTGSTHAVFTRIKTIAPDFFCHMGDLHYSDTNVEATWRAGLKSSLESTTIKPMLQTVTMPYDWGQHDAGGVGSDKDDPWRTFAPAAIRELAHKDQFTSTLDVALTRTWVHAGVRYIEIDRMAWRNDPNDVESSGKVMLGSAQRNAVVGWLQSAAEPAIIVFDGFPHYSLPQTGGQWGSYSTEAATLGAAIAALPAAQRDKIVFIGADSHAIHADSGANAMWACPNLCASPLDQTPNGTAPGTWSVGNTAATATRGYFSRLTFTYAAATNQLSMVWDAVRDDGTVVMTWSKTFGTTVSTDGWIKDPAATGGKRPFVRHRNPAENEDVDGGSFSQLEFAGTYDGGTPGTADFIGAPINAGGVNG